MQLSPQKELKFLVKTHLDFIYPEHDTENLTKRLLSIMDLEECSAKPATHENTWNEQDAWLITYGDSINAEGEKPLVTLNKFLKERLAGTVNGVHILPFFPYSSDDGFSVIDFSQVNDGLGEWEDIEAIAKEQHLMADLVINHCSSRSRWFDNFKQRREPGIDYFIEANPEEDYSAVVRPRTSPLLREVETLDGKRHVWCTFSHDQVDLNFANPEVLCEIIGIIKLYLDRGIRIFRLDAVAFLWKEKGSPCIHLPQTHEIIRLIRTLIEHHSDNAILITETNVPNNENLSYFGNANEAHAVYNFSLPPLLLHALVSGTAKHLKMWQMTMPPAQMGTFYFNFIASHDGIGLRPAEGLLSEEELEELVAAVQLSGARISWRTADGGRNKPYEINVTLFDALQGTVKGPDRWQYERFMCAHAIMFALEGIPAVYIHSFLATNNYYDGVELTSHNRTINRYKWNIDELNEKLEQEHSHHSRVFNGMQELLRVRTKQPAFHPNAVQYTLHLGDEIFGFWRQSQRRDQSIFCLHNVTDTEVTIPIASINLISLDTWVDLISGKDFSDIRQDVVLQPYQFVWLTNKAFI
ncbi:Sucrose phosphorylase [Thalassocella blandensis]|nr:Sucrose phosphorylase [Thalassocella blandensis]